MSNLLLDDNPHTQDTNSELRNDDQVNLSGSILSGGPYQLGTLLRKENHYNVYSILPDLQLDQDTMEVEACTYQLDNVSSKLHKYRVRSITRLYSRGILEARECVLAIVVYVVDNMATKKSKQGTTTQTLARVEAQPEIVKDMKPIGKSREFDNWTDDRWISEKKARIKRRSRKSKWKIRRSY